MREHLKWGTTHRVVLMLAAVVLLYFSDQSLMRWRLDVSLMRQVLLGQWFVWAMLLTTAGLLAGLAVRSVAPGRGFKTGRVVLMAAVPFALGMMFPLTVRGWLPETWGWLGSVRMSYFGPMSAGPMWVLVGVAIAAGFDKSGDRAQPSEQAG